MRSIWRGSDVGAVAALQISPGRPGHSICNSIISPKICASIGCLSTCSPSAVLNCCGPLHSIQLLALTHPRLSTTAPNLLDAVFWCVGHTRGGNNQSLPQRYRAQIFRAFWVSEEEIEKLRGKKLLPLRFTLWSSFSSSLSFSFSSPNTCSGSGWRCEGISSLTEGPRDPFVEP